MNAEFCKQVTLLLDVNLLQYALNALEIRDINETRETRKNFSVSRIEFLAIEK